MAVFWYDNDAMLYFLERVGRLKFYERNGFHRTDQKLKDLEGEFEASMTGKKLKNKKKESFYMSAHKKKYDLWSDPSYSNYDYQSELEQEYKDLGYNPREE